MEGNEELHIKRSDFPDGFLFGAATSSYQVDHPLFLAHDHRLIAIYHLTHDEYL